MNLYELTGEMLQLQQMMEECPDDDSIPDTMEFVAYDLGEKVDGYVKVIKNLQSDVDALARECRLLSKKKKYIENSITSLKKSLFNSLKVLNKDEIKGELFTIKKRKNPAKLPEEINIDDVPESYLIISEPKINRVELLKAVKNGDVKNINLIQEESLVIK